MFLRATGSSSKKTERYLESIRPAKLFSDLDQYGRRGVSALSGATPGETGRTATSWDYVIQRGGDSVEIAWTNDNDADGYPIVLFIQYGHGTGTGGYVRGRDFINPAMQPIFDKILADVWKKVTNG